MKAKKEKQPYISPENKMNPERLKNITNNPTKPVIEMNPEKIMPLHMFIGILEFIPIKNITQYKTIINLMATILHNKKTNKLEIRGRIRYEDTERKTVFNIPKEFKLTELNKAKKEIKTFYTDMINNKMFKEVEPKFEIDFKINDDIDSIIKKLNDSNKFNIGIAKKR